MTTMRKTRPEFENHLIGYDEKGRRSVDAGAFIADVRFASIVVSCNVLYGR